MRNAWLLGVLISLPQPGHAVFAVPKLPAKGAAAKTSKELAYLLASGELPPIALSPLPDHASPGPLAAGLAVRAFHLPPLGSGPAIRLRSPRPGAASASSLSHSVAEVERLGEDLRDAVSPLPTLDWFLAAVRVPDPRRRGEAVAAFGYPGNFAAIPYVSAVLLRLDEELAVRVTAARALGRIGDRRAWSFLARAVLDGEPQVRFAAAIALGRVTDRGGARLLSRALQSETDEDVRAALAWALSAARSRRF